MQYLLSVPENLASCWNEIVPDTAERRYIAAADPKGVKIGSGGATAWLLSKSRLQAQAKSAKAAGKNTTDTIKNKTFNADSCFPLGNRTKHYTNTVGYSKPLVRKTDDFNVGSAKHACRFR